MTTSTLKVGDKYWTYYVSPLGFQQVLHTTYSGDMTDRRRINTHRIFKDEAEAIYAIKNHKQPIE